jgi:FkbM family methyltransferase
MILDRKILALFPHSVRRSLKLDNPYPLVVDNRKILLPIETQGSFHNVFLGKSWKTSLIEYFTKISDGVFIDVGANLGQTLVEFWLAHSTNLYVGFEPNKLCVKHLRSLIKINSLNGYEIVPVGLFNETKSLLLYTQNGQETDSCATVLEDLRPGRNYDVDSVECKKFDDVFPTMNIEKISFIKIDVEGAELEVLQGMQATIEKQRPPILCEILFTDKKADLLFMKSRNELLTSLLEDWRYSIFQIVKSRDNSKVKSLNKISSFSLEYWSLKNKDLCDYLFVPTERENDVQEFIRS